MNDEPLFNADITYRYRDSASNVRLSDFKSKKKGSTLSQLFGGIVIAGYQSLTDTKVQEWWDKGIIERNVNNLRKINIDTNGIQGLSKTDAIRLYKVFFKKLTIKQVSKPFSSFDNFTWYSLGVAEK